MKKIVLIFILVYSAAVLFAEEEPEAFEEFSRALGFQAGEISGTGLSYQVWKQETGFQFTLGAVYVPPEEAWYSNILDYTSGFEVQHRVYGEDFTSWISGLLYLFAGLNHRGYIPVEEVLDEGSDPVTYSFETGSYHPIIALGGGIGIEIIIFRHFSVPFELGYCIFWNPLGGDFMDQFEINLVPQGGFRYRY